jgi:sensor histidine kinase YesM
LFIPFIENAFKHGVSYREPSSMIFKLSQFSDRLEFHSENTIPAFLAEKPSDYQGGFGLENIKKRLEMLYGNRHSISIENADNRFIVNLTIPV